MIRTTLRVTTVLALATTAWAQNDECTTAQSISVGSTPFDTSVATLSPEVWPCAMGGGPDLWYSFTATTTGDWTVSTCGSSYDTALEVFSGPCTSLVSIACNDDSCGTQSSITFAATSGTSYFCRVGGWNGNTGAGSLILDDGLPQFNAATGNYYIEVAASGITWDQARLDAEAMSYMGFPGRLATINSQQEDDFIFALGDVHYHWVGGFQNLQSPNYSEPAGGWEWITGEPFTYTNWLPGEPNNTGSFPSEDFLELLQGGTFGTTWNDAHPMEHPRGYIVEFSSGGFGTNYCMAENNSTGSPGSISAAGSSSAAANDLTLEATDLPNNQFGIFVTSRSQAFVPGAGGTSNGNLCLGGAIGRFSLPSQILTSGSNGAFSLVVDTTMIPEGSTFVSIMSGETWNFQAWHRDVVGVGSNFTNAIELVFN